MTTGTEAGTVTYQGILWCDGDYALDARGDLFQLRVHKMYAEDRWYWLVMGSENDWELGSSTYSDGPRLPLKRVVIREP